MALEDAYLLSHLLKKRDDLGNIFQKYDTIRRSRIKIFAKVAQRGGDMRRETGAAKERDIDVALAQNHATCIVVAIESFA